MNKTAHLSSAQKQALDAALVQGAVARSRRLMVTGVVIVLLAAATGVGLGGFNFFVSSLILFGMIVGCVPFLNRPISLVHAYTGVMQRLANDVKGTYRRLDKLPAYKELPLFVSLGWFKRREHVIDCAVDGVPVEAFVYTYRHPFENRYSRKKLRVIRLEFGTQMPHVLVRSKASGVLGKLDEHIPTEERVRVESEFEKKFDVYTHRRAASDALAILAPNLLAAMLDYGQNFDVELIGSSLYIYSDIETFNGDQADKELLYVSKLIKTFKHKLGNYKLVLPSDAYPFMESQPSVGTAHVGDSRPAGGWVFLGTYLAYASFITWLGWSKDSTFGRSIRVVIISLSAIAIAVFLIFKRRRPGKTKKGLE